MKKNTLTILFVFIIILIVLSAILNSGSKRNEDSRAGSVFLATLYEKINDINKINIVRASGNIEIVKTDKHWVLPAKENYPANLTQIRKILLNLAQLKIIEAKTKKEKNYEKLGVQKNKRDSKPVNVQSTIITLSTNTETLINIIIGNKKPGHTPGGKNLYYVRLSNNNQVWLVSGNINLPENNDFMNTELLNIESSRIQSIIINHPKSPQVNISKKAQSDTEFMLTSLTENKQLNPGALNSIASVISNLNFSDVTVMTNSDKSNKHTTATFTLFNGLAVNINVRKDNAKYYLWIEASSTIPMSTSLKQKDVENTSKQANAKDEAATINSMHKNWLYNIPENIGETLTKQIKDLVKPKAKE